MIADIQPWLSAVALLISIGASFYAWLTAGSRANGAEIKELAGRVTVLEQRVGTVENDVRHLPDRDHAQRMEVTLTELRGQLAVLSERLQPVSAIADRLQEFLLEQAKR